MLKIGELKTNKSCELRIGSRLATLPRSVGDQTVFLGVRLTERLIFSSSGTAGINVCWPVPILQEDVAMGLPGSQRSVQQLVDQHYEPLYRYAFRLSGSAADAEDLTQEAFCKAQLQMGQLREPKRAKAWLFSILRNAYLHRARSQRQHRQVALENVGELPEPAGEPLPDVDRDQLQRALNELPEVFRTPIILYYFEDFSYRDIAEQMDLPIGTVMSRLARAKAYLRTRLMQPAPAVLTDGPRRARDGL